MDKHTNIETDIAFKKAEKQVLPNQRLGINFGYSVNADRQINYDGLNRDMYVYLTNIEPSFKACTSCGTCSGSCSAAQFTDFSLRRILLSVKRGETSMLSKEIHKCMLCGKCQLVCPNGVNTRNLILTLKNLEHE